MKIYVCVKHVPDTAAKITVVGDSGFAESCKFIVNPYAALALGADRGILVRTDAQFLDSGLTSRALQKAIEQDGGADLIFCGRQSIDSEGMQTPYRLAQAMDMAVVSDVVALSVGDGKAVAEREIGGGFQTVTRIGHDQGVIGNIAGADDLLDVDGEGVLLTGFSPDGNCQP